MKAAVLFEARQPLRIEELEMPEVGDEDVLIKVAACGGLLFSYRMQRNHR